MSVLDWKTINTDINAGKQYVIAANHVDSRDPFFIIGALPLRLARRFFPIRFMTYSGYYFTLGRPFEFAAGCFPTKSKNPKIPAGVEGAIKLLNKGSSVLIFPEGKRTAQGEERAHSGLERILRGADENIGLILARVHWHDKKHFTLTYANGDEFRNSSSQEILDAIYKLPS